MADSRKLFPNALTGLPAPERRVLDSIGMNIAHGKPENGYGKPSIASVDSNSPNTLVIHDPQRFKQGGQQVLAHEGVHLWQNNLPPTLAAKIPPDNQQNPYGFSLQELRDTRQRGGNLLSLPREKAASAIQYFVANGGENAPKPIKDAIGPYAEDMNLIPLSTIMPTDPNQKGINTTPRPPMALPQTYHATSIFRQGAPPPKDDDPYAAFGGNIVHTGTGGTDPYAEFGGSIVHGPAAPGTGLNRYGQIDYGTGLAPAQQSQEGATPPPTPSWMQRMAGGGENLGKGLLKGLGGNSVLGIDQAVSKIPYVGKALTTPLIGGKTSAQAISDLQNRTQTNGTMQKFGKGLEGALEFLIPGLGEDAATADIARVTPKLMPAARIGYNALTSGLLNKAQGGNFWTGAAAGGGAGLLGEGTRIVAPALAESALGVRGIDRLYGRTPGRAILEDTRGIRPAKVASTAQRTIDRLTPEAENIATRARQSGVRGSLFPARQAVASRIGSHEANRAMESAAELKPLQHALATDRLTGLPLAENQTPLGLMRLKRGINSDFIGNWKPDQSPGLRTTAKQAYSAVNNQLHHVAPGLGPIDQRISSLIPVAKRAEAQEVSAPFVQRVLGRMKAHTGAATLGGIGAIGGYERGGPKKALEYGLIGLAAPEILASPSVQMAGARTLHSPVVKKLLVPAAKGGALQLAARRRK